ncbi:MAG: universal stress protein [Haloplanus sp.]|jgi:nucleotide-binding universal stress UspA family protein
MYDTILVPTDGSDGTATVLEHALSIAGDGTTVHGVYVMDRRRYTAARPEETEAVKAALREEGERALAFQRETLEDAGVPAVTALRDGIPHRTILEYAAEQDVDLIVIGTHGRTGPDRLVNLGSTTERVVKNGDVPVLVVDI